MTQQDGSTVIGVFDRVDRADRAAAALRQAGFSAEQIGVALRGGDVVGGDPAAARPGKDFTRVLTGAAIGALAGAAIMVVVSLTFRISLFGGWVGAALGGAVLGAWIGGLLGPMLGAGKPEKEARYHQIESQTGRATVSCMADGRRSDAVAILREHGASRIDDDRATRGTVSKRTDQSL